jgi:hypothetical protein
MPAKSRFTRLDAFTKTVEDARVRTTSGGIVTITSLLVIFWLAWGEWADYRRVIVRPELVVDKGRGTLVLCCAQNWRGLSDRTGQEMGGSGGTVLRGTGHMPDDAGN